MQNLCLWMFVISGSYIQISDSLGVLSLRLVSYSNPDGKTADGNCCEHIFPIFGCASGDCDPSLQICIHDNTQTGSCSNIQYKAGPYDNTASVTFGSKVGALGNPIQLLFQIWKSQFVVSIAVYDDDTDGGHDHIGTITLTPNKAPGYNGSSTAYTHTYVGGYARLNILYDVHCLENYYGDDCTLFCQPDEIHYVCNAEGGKLCLQGWTGSDCLTSINDCHVMACFNSGTCEDLHNAYRCHCSEDFTGDRCEIRIPKESSVQRTKSPLPFETITNVTDIMDTTPQETIATEITIMTDYSSQPQTVDPLNLSLSQVTTSFPTEEFESVKTDTEVSSTNPREIAFMETNEATVSFDMTTEIETRTSMDNEMDSVSKSNNESQESVFYNTVTNNELLQNTSEQYYELSTFSDNDTSSTSEQIKATDEIPYMVSFTDLNKHYISTESSNGVSLVEGIVSSEIISTTEISSTDSEFTGLEFLSTLVPSAELEKGNTLTGDTNDLTYTQTETYGKEEQTDRQMETYSTHFGYEVNFTDQISTENSQVSGDNQVPSTTFTPDILSSTLSDKSTDRIGTNPWPDETEVTKSESTPYVPAVSTESGISRTNDFKITQSTTFDTEGTRFTHNPTEDKETTNTLHQLTASTQDKNIQENTYTSYSQENVSNNVMEFTTSIITSTSATSGILNTFNNSPGMESIEANSTRPFTKDAERVSTLELDTLESSTTYNAQSHSVTKENSVTFDSILETTTTQSSFKNTATWLDGSTQNQNTVSETTDVPKTSLQRDFYLTTALASFEQSSKTSNMELSTLSNQDKSTHFDTDAHLTKGGLTTEVSNKWSTSGKQEHIYITNILASTQEILTDNESKPNLVTTTKAINITQSSPSSTSSIYRCQSRFFIDAIGELVIEVNSFFEFPTVKREMLTILEQYGVSKTEAKFNYTLYSTSVYSVWMKFDSRTVPLKMSDISQISAKVCKSLQYYRSGDANQAEVDTGLGSGSLAAIIVSMLYLAILLIIAIFLIHRKYKERNKVGSTPDVSENPCISKAPMKTSLEADSNC